MTKTAQLLAALQQGRTVTRGTAMLAFKIANLTAEIGTLRKRGHKIEAITGSDGSGVTNARYTKWIMIQPTPVVAAKPPKAKPPKAKPPKAKPMPKCAQATPTPATPKPLPSYTGTLPPGLPTA